MNYVIAEKETNLFYPLRKPLLNFGSSEAADVVVEGLPPLAFQIRQEENQWVLTDLCGKGLLCNGKQASNTPLKEGDELQLLSWKGVFKNPTDVQLKNAPEIANREALESLLHTFTTILKNGGAEEVPLQILQFACEVMHADHGLLKLEQKEEYFPREGFKVSRQGIEFALEKKETLLWNFGDDSSLDVTKSIAQNQLTSLLVFPFGRGQWFYLQRQAGDHPFIEEDRLLFQSIGQFLEALLCNSETLEKQTEEIERLREVRRKGPLLYADPKMIAVIEMGEKVASQNIPLLIRGETGTGKERFARFIHEHSPRKEGPFVAINCGAIPSNLIESVLFGHKKGSFTGANEDRQGVFEQAHGGSVFLDEIGELDLSLQVRLLRVLQEKKVTPLGETKEISVDVRILSATHVDLEKALAEGRFREDLLFRLNVMQINLPPLRERMSEVMILAEEFLKRFAKEFKRSLPKFSKAAEKKMLQHSWPGNVRELENRIQKALVLCEDRVEPEHLKLGETGELKPLYSLKEAREKAEDSAIRRALREAKGNLSLAARMLDIDRKVLRDHMERLHIHKDEFKEK